MAEQNVGAKVWWRKSAHVINKVTSPQTNASLKPNKLWSVAACTLAVTIILHIPEEKKAMFLMEISHI